MIQSRSLNLATQDLKPQRTLVVRTHKAIYGFRYSCLLHWEATPDRLTLDFADAVVVVHGTDLAAIYVSRLVEDCVSELIEPERAEKFVEKEKKKTGSAGVERIQVVYKKPE
jgi:hypothetical protein